MKLTAANYEIDRLTVEWNKERHDGENVKNKLEDAVKNNELQKQSNDGLKQQVEEANITIEELRGANKAAESDLTNAREEIEMLQNELQYLHDRLRESGNNFEDIIQKARCSSRLGRTRDLNIDTTKGLGLDEPDDMAYTMEFERDETSPPGSAPVGLSGVRSIRSGRASANTSVADTDGDYQDDFASPVKSSRKDDETYSARGGVTFPDIAAGNRQQGNGSVNGDPNSDALDLIDHPYDNSSCEEDESQCGKSLASRQSAGSSKKKGKKKRTTPKVPCSECQKKYKGKGYRLPTALHNAKVEETPHTRKPKGELSGVVGHGEYGVAVFFPSCAYFPYF